MLAVVGYSFSKEEPIIVLYKKEILGLQFYAEIALSKLSLGGPDAQMILAWNHDNTIIALANGDNVSLFKQYPNGRWQLFQTIDIKSGITSSAWSFINNTLAVTTDDNDIHLYHIVDDELKLFQIVSPTGVSNLKQIIWNPRTDQFCLLSAGKTILLNFTTKNSSNGQYILGSTITTSFIRIPVAYAIWNPDGTTITINSDSGDLIQENYQTQLYTIATNSWQVVPYPGTIDPKTRRVMCFNWSFDGTVLYSLFDNGILHYDRIKPPIDIRACSVAQIVTLLLIQKLQKTIPGQQKLKDNIKFITTIIQKFPSSLLPFFNAWIHTVEESLLMVTDTKTSAAEEKKEQEPELNLKNIQKRIEQGLSISLKFNGKTLSTPPQLIQKSKILRELYEKDVVSPEEENPVIILDTLRDYIVPDIFEKNIARYVVILTYFYNDRAAFDKEIQKLSSIDLMHIYQLGHYLDLQELREYFFNATDPHFLRLFIDQIKNSSQTLTQDCAPLVKAIPGKPLNTAGNIFIESGDIKLKKLLIDYIKNSLLLVENNTKIPYKNFIDVAWSNENIIALLTIDINFFSLNKQEPKLSPIIKSDEFFPFSRLLWNTTGSIITLTINNRIRMWKRDKNTFIKLPDITTTNTIKNCAWNKDNVLMTIEGENTDPEKPWASFIHDTLKMYTLDGPTWNNKQTIAINTRPTYSYISPSYITWHPADSVCAVLTEDLGIHILIQKDGSLVKVATLIKPPLTSHRSELTWSPNGQFLSWVERTKKGCDVVLYTQQPSGDYTEYKRIPTIITSTDNRDPILLAWNPLSNKIALIGQVASHYALRVYDLSKNSWNNITADNPFRHPKILRWGSDGLTLYNLNYGSPQGAISSFFIDFPEAQLMSCSFNQLMIIIILHTLRNTDAGNKKIHNNIAYVRELIASFSEAARTALEPFFNWIMDTYPPLYTPLIPPSTASSSIKNDLEYVARDMHALTQKIR